MTHSLADYPMMFISSFVLVFLLGLQSKNVNQSRYLAAVVTSLGISVANFLFIKYAADGDLAVFFVCAAGGCAGIAFSIWFSDHVLKRPRPVQPIDWERVDTDRAVRTLMRPAACPDSPAWRVYARLAQMVSHDHR